MRSESKNRFHVVLLAGGSGTRFWPLSRRDSPKQFLALSGRDPLLVATWRRVRKLAPPSRIWVVAPKRLVPAVTRMLPGLLRRNLVVEPGPRDTGPAIALATESVVSRDESAVIGFFPTDHVIRDDAAFRRSVEEAARAASRGALVCLGVRPTHPATGYGYLRCSRRPRGVRAVKVEEFVEKPDAGTAARFLRSGEYLWNGGMFVWSGRKFLETLGRTAPRIRRAVRGYMDGDPASWERATRLSVDYAVMERADDVAVVPLDAGWDDVGSWAAAARLRETGPKTLRKDVLVDSEGAVVFGGDRMVAVVGVPDVAVVDTPDALLVVARDRAEDVKQVVETLRRRNRSDLL